MVILDKHAFVLLSSDIYGDSPAVIRAVHESVDRTPVRTLAVLMQFTPPRGSVFVMLFYCAGSATGVLRAEVVGQCLGGGGDRLVLFRPIPSHLDSDPIPALLQ